jgi:hypothetical protein
MDRRTSRLIALLGLVVIVATVLIVVGLRLPH